MLRKETVLGLVLAAAWGIPAGAAEEDAKLARQAYSVLKKHCAACHTGAKPKSRVADYDVLSHASLTKARKDDDDKPYRLIVPKDLKQSALWERVGVDGTMPPMKVKTRPSAEDKAVLKKWIEAGAPAFPKAKEEKKGAAAPRFGREAAWAALATAWVPVLTWRRRRWTT
jgi:hypothetical protein